ncbi:MAG: N-acetyltransferase [Candidatus Omnitrophica bacterium]|nr:N-acetyltransferase [Candidatus Omnitrophota bacterium]
MADNSFISEKSIITNADIGKNVKIWHYCNIYGCKIGNNTQIGSYCEIKKNAKIGENCRIQAFVFIPENIIIGNYVFIGPHVVFTNDKYPTAVKAISSSWKCEETKVGDNVSIGAGAIICPGIKIAEATIIGAGSCLTKDTNAFSVVAGNPAKKIADIRDKKYAKIYKDIIDIYA